MAADGLLDGRSPSSKLELALAKSRLNESDVLNLVLHMYFLPDVAAHFHIQENIIENMWGGSSRAARFAAAGQTTSGNVFSISGFYIHQIFVLQVATLRHLLCLGENK